MRKKTTPPQEPILVYQAEDGLIRVDVRMDGETAWLTQEQIAQLFERERSVITKHAGNAFAEGELPEEGNVQICTLPSPTNRCGDCKEFQGTGFLIMAQWLDGAMAETIRRHISQIRI